MISDYDFLIPNRIEGYIIIRLWQKIKSGEIQEEFSYNDIKNIVNEVTALTNGATPQIEKILKDLLHYFIKKPPETVSKYYYFLKRTFEHCVQNDYISINPMNNVKQDLKVEEIKKDMESTAESVEKVETSKVEENKEKTFTRDEVNKMINAEKQKQRQSILEEMEAKKAENKQIDKTA